MVQNVKSVSASLPRIAPRRHTEIKENMAIDKELEVKKMKQLSELLAKKKKKDEENIEPPTETEETLFDSSSSDSRLGGGGPGTLAQPTVQRSEKKQKTDRERSVKSREQSYRLSYEQNYEMMSALLAVCSVLCVLKPPPAWQRSHRDV